MEAKTQDNIFLFATTVHRLYRQATLYDHQQSAWKLFLLMVTFNNQPPLFVLHSSSALAMGLESDRLCLTDDDLTNLNWLQDGNLLRNVTGSVLNNSKAVANLKKETGSQGTEKLSAQDLRSDQTEPQSESKPPFSFSCLIFMAIESSQQKALPVKQIYSWITDHFPFYRSAAGGWKNTVRHNLSLNRCFRKVSSIHDDLSVGKGSLWSVVPTYRQALLDSIRSTSESSTRHYLPTKTMIRPDMKW